MKKLVLAAAVAATMTTGVNAATYDVSGTFVGGAGAQSVEVTLDTTTNVIAPGGTGLTIGGTVTADTDTAGYSITGGTLTLSGSIVAEVTCWEKSVLQRVPE